MYSNAMNLVVFMGSGKLRMGETWSLQWQSQSKTCKYMH